MPFLHRPVLVILAFIAAFFLLSYFSVSSLSFTFSPLIFPSTTLITLTDDNSTFFVSRPAAFGPQISKAGVVGELYVLEDGELACGEAKGFDSRVHSLESQLPELADDGTDDIRSTPVNFDERLFSAGSLKSGDSPVSHESAAERDRNKNGASTTSADAGEGVHSDIESLQESAAMNGKIVLVKRGGCGFLEKVLWAQRRGAAALIVGDNEPGRSLITMYAKGDTSNVTIPSIFTSHTTAHILITLLPVNFRLGETNSHPTPLPTASVNGDGDSTQPEKLAQPSHLAVVVSEKNTHNNAHQVIDNSHRPPTSGELDFSEISPPLKASEKSTPTEPPKHREGLWLTLTPGGVSSSPFFDTLLVMVVSPLITLTIVYTMLTIRSHLRRRRWRAPKSYVERLPVRTYHPESPNTNTNANDDNCWRSANRMEEGASNSSNNGSTRRPRTSRRRSQFQGHSEECVVCLEEYIDGVSRVMKLPCGHEFHEGCITPWLITRRRTCPICKGDVVRYMDSNGLDEDEEEEEDWTERPSTPRGVTEGERRGRAGSTGSARGLNVSGDGAVTERTPLVNGE